MKDRQRRPGRGMPFRKSTDPASGGWKATLRVRAPGGRGVGTRECDRLFDRQRGLSAHDEAESSEEILASAMRRWATPQAMRDRTNPVQPTPEVINQALGHYADHCATCHANDGSGDTEIGRGLYPRCPTCARRTRSH